MDAANALVRATRKRAPPPKLQHPLESDVHRSLDKTIVRRFRDGKALKSQIGYTYIRRERTMRSCSTVPKTPRRGCKDVFNEFMLKDIKTSGYYQIPVINPTRKIPKKLVTFSDAVCGRVSPEPGTWFQFYEDDCKFERFWDNPRKYAELLRGYEGCIAPDYSLYADFTQAQKIWNTYRNYTSGAWLQQTMGFEVLANVRTAGLDSIPYSLAGAPHNSPIAIGSHGCLKNRTNRSRFTTDLKIVVDTLHPSLIIVYGTASYGAFDYPKQLGIPIAVFPSVMTQRLGDARER